MDFFILGNPRSGTSLFRLMLNSHSQIGVPPECGFLHWWYAKYKNWNKDDIKNRDYFDDFLHDILNSKKIEDWKLDRFILREYIISEEPESYIKLIDSVYRFYCRNKLIIGDKNNYYIHHLDEINRIDPNAKYIHLVRDGRDVACSYLEVKKINQALKYLPTFSSNIPEIANEWNNNISAIDNFITNKLALTIRYEDLISFPEKVLSETCNFLGVTFEQDMLKFYLNFNNDEPESTIYWKMKTLEKLDASNSQKFLKKLSQAEIDTFNKIAYSNLKKFNYE